MKMYKSIGMYHPHQLDMEDITRRLGMTLIHMPVSSLSKRQLFLMLEKAIQNNGKISVMNYVMP